MMTALQTCFEKARGSGARVVFPEWDEARTVEARVRLEAEGLCVPVPVAAPSEGQLAALVANRGVSERVARRMLDRPMIRAAAMVAAGEAEALVAGAGVPSRRVIEAAGLAIGLAPEVAAPSSFFLMRFPDGRELVFADCAVVISPDAETLAGIARASAATGTALFGEARVALLSYSTGGSGAGTSVEKVRAAAEMTGLPGPVQADAALNPLIAARKGAGQGDANVLVFPNLDAGNIAYKLCQELAGAQAIGPILQGFRRPVCDLSRGATVDDIVAAVAVTLALRR